VVCHPHRHCRYCRFGPRRRRALGVVCSETFSSEKFVVPICSAMGFAYVLKLTRADQHLVRLLVGPIRSARFFLVPWIVLVGFVVNIPIISQTSTAVCIGTVVVR
jgi:DcuC family C4-dicarboxylate transporter